MEVFTYKNASLHLENKALGQGGEGTVYEIRFHPNNKNYVAKIYADPTDAKKHEDKILQMTAISKSSDYAREQIGKYIAWPILPLYNQKHEFIGFGMEKITAKFELDDIYKYPAAPNMNVSILNRIDILISLCDAIERLHNIGQVFGDFNPNNIKIKADWTVCFVDADSYHIHVSGMEYPCIVCAEGYVAPEIVRACKGKPYADCPGNTFTKESDYHALAIHIFRMLENGCHPFSFKKIPTGGGSSPAPLPLDKRVEMGVTPYFNKMAGYKTPNFAPDVNAFPPYMLRNFQLAFVEGNQNPSKRPTANEWKQALQRFRNELQQCKKDSFHYYWNGIHNCPYCEADQRQAQTIKKYLQNRNAAANAQITVQAQSQASNLKSAHKQPQASYGQSNHQNAQRPANIPWYASTKVFALISLVGAIIMGVYADMYITPQIVNSNYGYESASIFVWVGAFIGWFLYLKKWASKYRKNLKDYILSMLCSGAGSVIGPFSPYIIGLAIIVIIGSMFG